ncbi:MAG: helix-turn-helix domain-containing protein [Alicyclobacillus sp.]|nr:helix-turn-helix domain-containing protein [Alicyclobacillus sp.]
MSLKLNLPALMAFLQTKQWTPRDLAQHMGVSYTTVYRVMRGTRRPGNEFIAKLLGVTNGLTFDDLFIYDAPLPNGNDAEALQRQSSSKAATA